ncbi:hypothetical protein N0X72_25310 [Streptomyces carpaticus]|uniref:hypothetical protein n=1 Tax=Streptomyces carpaticus TaxID=285558 RepID=UPI00220A9CFD|nr:hypothetical protein N0X72_25310 [Streptomyces carpaticus]
MTVRAAWLLPQGQTREDTRLAPVGTMTPDGALGTRPGVIPGGDALAAEGVGPMDVQLSTGRAVVQGTVVQGAYPVAVSSPETLTLTDGDQQHARIDTLVIRAYDGLYDTDGQTLAAVEIMPGTPEPTPVAPTLPPAVIPLWDIRVPAGASAGTGGIPWASALTDRRRWTVAAGGIVPRQSDTTPGPYVGAYRDTGTHLQRWDGAEWRDYPARPVWRDWSPTWTTSSGQRTPAWGNASRTCRYLAADGVVHLSFEIVFGSSTAFGASPTTADNWRFSLPTPARAVTGAIGWAELTGGTQQRCVSRVRAATTNLFELDISSGSVGAAAQNGGIADSVSPWTWTAGHGFRGTAMYEPA